MRDLVSALGFVFEGAFKVGFLESVAPELVEGFKRGLFEKLRQELRQELVSELEGSPECWRGIGTHIDESVAEEKYAKLAYLFGYYSGRLYGGDKEGAQLEKYQMGEESGHIVWQNADLLFLKDRRLHVVDFKLAGFASWIKRVFEVGKYNKEQELPYIPVVNYGVPVNLSVGELDFVEFVKSFVQQQDKLQSLGQVFVELKGFAQLLCYATDYLIERSFGNLKEVVLELLYPASESLRVRFYLRGKEDELEDLREVVREIYKSLKEKEDPYQMLDKDFEKVAGKRERAIRKLQSKIEELEKEVQNRQREIREIKPDPIDLCRQDVSLRLKEFFKKQEDCKAICLLHSAGSGKTSNIRNHILAMEGKHMVIYVATRLRLIEKEMEELQKRLKEKNRQDVKLIREKRQTSQQKFLRHSGNGFEDTQGQDGIIKRTVKSIADSISERKYNQIWAFITQQAHTDTYWGDTLRYLSDPRILNRNILKQWQVHIILDEFLGYRNGLYAINGMLDLLQKIKKSGGRANLYILDANGYSPYLLDRLLREFEDHGVVPDCMILCPFKESLYTERYDVPVEMHAKHGYPSGQLFLHRKFFLWVDKKEDLAQAVGKYIRETLDKESTGFAFVQDKDLIVDLSHYLEKEGLSSLVATASSRQSQKAINEGSQDVILGTSSVSRGLDFSRPHKPVNHIYVLVVDWGIEQNLVEILQAISRARGDENTENKPKHLHLMYVVPQEKDYVIDNLESLVEFKDRELIRLIYRGEQIYQRLVLDQVVGRVAEQFLRAPEGAVLVPVPAQHKSVYRANKVSEMESVKTFLEDVYLMEYKRDPEKAKKILEFLKVLSSAVYFSTNDVPRDFDSSKHKYYHPYLVIEGKVRVKFDNEKRKVLMAKLKELEETLKRHNEEKWGDVKKFVENTDSLREYDATFLLPVYSIVFVKHVLREGEDSLLNFRVGKRVGRGGAVVLGGGLNIITRCLVSDTSPREYAVIPLGEDYPYLEVLSGRFAKFPIEFLQKLMEGKDAEFYSQGVGRAV